MTAGLISGSTSATAGPTRTGSGTFEQLSTSAILIVFHIFIRSVSANHKFDQRNAMKKRERKNNNDKFKVASNYAR